MKQMGFLGPLGTHSEAAAIYLKGMVPEKYELVSCANIYEAIHQVEQGQLDSCLVPVETPLKAQ